MQSVHRFCRDGVITRVEISPSHFTPESNLRARVTMETESGKFLSEIGIDKFARVMLNDYLKQCEVRYGNSN